MAQIPTAPPFLKGVLGKNADVREIPETSAVGEGRLNFNSGFPAENALPPSAGGVAPQREDFNAVNKLVTQHLYWLQAGGCYPWRDDLDYIKGCHAMGSDDKEYICQRWCGPGSTAGAKDPTDSEASKYYWWAPAEETQIATNTAAIAELKETVSTAVTDVSEAVAKVETIGEQVDANTSDISSLGISIQNLDDRLTTDEQNISTHTSDISGLTTRMATAEGHISTLFSDEEAISSDISSLKTRMTTAEGNISSNDTDIAALQSRMTTAEGNIKTNASGIATNASDIADLETLANTHTTDIESLEIRVSTAETKVDSLQSGLTVTNRLAQTNKTNIATNTSDIATLKTAVSTNTSDLTALTARVTTAEGDIDSLEERMTAAEGSISDNASAISTNKSVIATNAKSIASLKAQMTTAESSIKTNQTDIATLKTGVSGNATAIAANAKSIGTNASAITALDGRVTTAEGEIDTLQSDLTSLTGRVKTNEDAVSGLKTTTSTNTTNIKTNADDIAALKTSVAANTTNISTNAGNISALQTQVATNTSDIAALSGDTSITEKLTALEGRMDTADGNISANTTNISTLTTNLSAAVTRIDDVTNWESTAQMHNNIYRGANLLDGHFSSIADIMTAVRAGNFADIYVGDYIPASFSCSIDTSVTSTNFRIAAINLLNARNGAWGSTSPNLCIVPDKLGSAYMNSTNTSAGGYVGSYMYKTVLPAYYTALAGSSGKPFYGYIKTTTERLSNGIDTAKSCGGYSGWTGAVSSVSDYTNQNLVLLNEPEVYGCKHWSSSEWDAETIAVQLPMFRLNPNTITNNGTAWWWLRAVTGSTYFCYVNGALYARCFGASDVRAVRPRFFIA